MAKSTPNPVSNPAGSTQTPSGRVVRDSAPVFDAGRGHLMPAGHSDSDRQDHHVARTGQAGHQR